MENEIWKDIPNYKGLYQVSDLGRVKSLQRKILIRNKHEGLLKERILKPSVNSRKYNTLVLWNNGVKTTWTVHSLVAQSFLNHIPCGKSIHINHINFNRTDNRLCNLEVITSRKNTNRKHLRSTSKYVGVYYYKAYKKWRSQIVINAKQVHLGYFEKEYDAHLAYQKSLKELL